MRQRLRLRDERRQQGAAQNRHEDDLQVSSLRRIQEHAGEGVIRLKEEFQHALIFPVCGAPIASQISGLENSKLNCVLRANDK